MQATLIFNQALLHVIARTTIDMMHVAGLLFMPTYEN